MGTPGAAAPPDPNFLTQALKARKVKRPFASLGTPAPMTPYAASLGPQVPSAATGPAPVAPPATPSPEDPIASATRRVQEALDAARDYKPYATQDTTFQAPERPKKSVAAGVAEGLGMLFTHGQAGLNYAEGMQETRDREEAQYQQRYGEAQDAYSREVARQTRLATRSDAQQKNLDHNVDLAEHAQKNVIDTKKYADADAIAQQRADSYAASISDRNVNAMARNTLGWASLKEKAHQDAATIGVRNLALTDGILRTRIQTTAALQRSGLSASVAMQLAGQRNNLSLYEARMRDATTRVDARDRIDLQTSLARARQLGAQYDTVIRAASQLGAPESTKAAAAQLLAAPQKLDAKGQPVLDSQGNPVPGGPSPYDAFIGSLARIGIPAVSVPGLDEVQSARQDAHESYMNGTYVPGSYSPYGPTDVGAGVGGDTSNNQLLHDLVMSLAQGRNSNQMQSPDYSPAQGGAQGGGQGGGSITVPAQYQPLITHAASAAGIPADLYTRLLSSESSFVPNAVGRYADGKPSGALGMAQFMPETGAAYGLNSDADRNDPSKAISAGAFFLRDNLRTFQGNQVLAVAAYNAGPQAVKDALHKANGDPNTAISFLPPETQAYVQKILGGGGPIATGAPTAQPAAQVATTPRQPAVGRKGTAGKPVAAPAAAQATPEQIGHLVVQMYDRGHDGQPYETAWPDIKATLIKNGASPADLKAAETRLLQHAAGKVTAAQTAARGQAAANAEGDQERILRMHNPSMPAGRVQAIAEQRNAPPPPEAPEPKPAAVSPVSLARELVTRATSMGPMQPGDRAAIVNAIAQKTGIPPQQAERIVDAVTPHHRGVTQQEVGNAARGLLGGNSSPAMATR